MYWKCPYCDSKVYSRKVPCRNCGAPASGFVCVYEDADYADKTSPGAEDKRFDVFRTIALLAAIGGWFVPGAGFLINLAICILCRIKKDVFWSGRGKAAFYIALVHVIVVVVFWVIAMLFVLFTWNDFY